MSIAQVADGLRDFRPSAELSPGRMNLFRLGQRTVIVDFAHNEAGTEAILDVAAAIAGGAAGRAAPVTAIIGTAGDRPDDTLRGIGRIAATKAQRVAIKETLDYLRGREREGIVASIRAGIAEGGMDPATVPVYETEATALEAELSGASGAASTNGRGRRAAGRRPVLPRRARGRLRAARRGSARARSTRPTACATSRRASRTSAAADRHRGAARAPPRAPAYPSGASSSPGSANAVPPCERPASVIASLYTPTASSAHTTTRSPGAARRNAARTADASSSTFSTLVVRPRPSSFAAFTPAATLVAVSPGRRPRRFASSRM